MSRASSGSVPAHPVLDEGGHQQQQRAARQMEVRDQRIHRPIRVGRDDVQVGPALRVAGLGQRLQDPGRSWSRPPPPARHRPWSGRWPIGSPRGTTYHSRWIRCSSTNVPSSGWKVSSPTWRVTAARSTPACASSSRRRGVKWRPAVGAAADPGRLGVDRLVPLVGRLAGGDVRRERHLARIASISSIGSRGRVTARIPSPTASPTVMVSPFVQLDRCARWQAATRPDEGLPLAVGQRAEEQDLGRSPTGSPSAEAGSQDAAVVDDQKVTRLQPPTDVREPRLGQRPAARASRSRGRGPAGGWRLAARPATGRPPRSAARSRSRRPGGAAVGSVTPEG